MLYAYFASLVVAICDYGWIAYLPCLTTLAWLFAVVLRADLV